MSGVSKQIDVIEDKVNWHWRYSMQPIRFFMFDARAALTLPILLLYFRPITVAITILNLLFFRFLEQRGLTFPSALRNLRAWIVGQNRPRLVSVLKNKFVDYK